MVQKILLKDISIILALLAILLRRVEQFVQFCRGHYEEHICEIILNLGQWLRSKCVRVSPEALHCVLEQDTLSSA